MIQRIQNKIYKPNRSAKSLIILVTVLCCILGCMLVMNMYMHHSLQETNKLISNLQHEVKSYKASSFSEILNHTNKTSLHGETSPILQNMSSFTKKVQKRDWCESTNYFKVLKSVKPSPIEGNNDKLDLSKLEKDLQTALYLTKESYKEYAYQERLGLLIPVILFPREMWSLLLMLSSYTPVDDIAPVIFKMSNFTDKLKCAGPWYSKPFLTFDKGHRMCLVVHVGGYGDGEGTHLSVYLYLMKGPYDDELELSGHFPLNTTFKVELLHQLDDYNRFSTYITINNTACSECTNRVIGGDMAPSGWGNPQFVPHNIILHHNYSDFIKDNNLYFMITLVSPLDFETDFFAPQVWYVWWSLMDTFGVLIILFIIAEKFDIVRKYFVLCFFILLSATSVFVVSSFWRGILWSAITTVVGLGGFLLAFKIEESWKLDTELTFVINLALLVGSSALSAVLLSDIS